MIQFAILVLLVYGILKFQTLVDLFGSYALVEITLLLLVILLRWRYTSSQKNTIGIDIIRNNLMIWITDKKL